MSEQMTHAGSGATAISYPPGTGDATGSQAIIELQKAFYQGSIPREAAIGASTILCNLSTADADRLFLQGHAAERRVLVKTPTVIVAAVIGCLFGYSVGNALISVARNYAPGLTGSPIEALIPTAGVFIGAVAAVLAVFGWTRHAKVA
jgi:hypothetical protein